MALLRTPFTLDLWTSPANPNAGSEEVVPVLTTAGIRGDVQPISSNLYQLPQLDVPGDKRILYLPDTLASIDTDHSFFYVRETGETWKPVMTAQPFSLGSRLGHWTVVCVTADHPTITEHYS